MNVIGVAGLLLALLIGAILIFFKKPRIVGVLLLVCGIGFGGWQWRREDRWSHGFSTLRDGASQEEVVTLLGHPTFRASSEMPPFGYSLSDRNKNVKMEFWYVSFFVPQQFTFGFDARGILIDRYQYASP